MAFLLLCSALFFFNAPIAEGMTICELCTCRPASWIVKCNTLPPLETLAAVDNAHFVTLDLAGVRRHNDIRLLEIYRAVIMDIFGTVLMPEDPFSKTVSPSFSSPITPMLRLFTPNTAVLTSVKPSPHTAHDVHHTAHVLTVPEYITYAVKHSDFSSSRKPLSDEIIGLISGVTILAILVIVMIGMFIAILLIIRQKLDNNIRLAPVEMHDL